MPAHTDRTPASAVGGLQPGDLVLVELFGVTKLSESIMDKDAVRLGASVPIAGDVVRAHVFDGVTGRALHHPEP